MRMDVAIIGGTGIGDVLMARPGTPVHVPTSEGWLRGRAIEEDGRRLLFVHRHAKGHRLPPHAVRYKAIALGLKTLGIRWCLASAAVGSLRADWTAGTLAACTDFLDLTARNLTLHERRVHHTDFSEPLSSRAAQALVQSGQDAGHTVQPQAVYVCGNGPRYETPHEIRLLAHVGDVIGMTAASEAIVMREAGIGYGCLALVTNLAAGLATTPLSHEEVVTETKAVGSKALQTLLGAAARLSYEAGVH